MITLHSLKLVSLAGALLCTPIIAQAQNNPVHSVGSPFSSSESVAQKQQMEDQKIIEIIATIDKNEIAAANLVKQKQVSHTVRDYAKYLHRQHTKNLDKLAKLSKETGLQPMNSTLSTSLAQEGQQGFNQLSELDNKVFETAYINAMVQGHTAGLNLIDTNLSKNATNPTLQSFIKKTRTMVATHLKRAIRIQKKLQ